MRGISLGNNGEGRSYGPYGGFESLSWAQERAMEKESRRYIKWQEYMQEKKEASRSKHDKDRHANPFLSCYLEKETSKIKPNIRAYHRGLDLLDHIDYGDKLKCDDLLSYQHPNEIYLDTQDIYGSSILHVCALRNNVDLLKKIIAKGADMNIKDQEGKTPLFYALRCKNIETVQALIEAGADIHIRDNNRNTPIAFAAKCGNERAVNLLFKSGANPYTVSSGCDACIKKNKKAWDLGIKLLNSINDRGISLIAEDLLQNHSHPFGINLNVQNQDGATALIKAVRFNHTKLAQQLIQCGADMDITDKGGNTALHEAAALGHEELVQTLINAKANLNVQNSKGETPLHRAINQKNTPVVRALLTVGADKEIKTNSGATALDLAKESNYYDAIQLLSNTKDYSPYLLGWRLFNTLKHLKDGKEKEEKINQLIHLTHPSVINFDVQSPQDGNTPLHFAIKNNYLAVAKALINAKAQVNTQNNKGETPLHIAALNLKCDIIQDLLLAGADKEIKNLESKTAFELMTKKVEALFNTNKEPVVIKKANSNSFKEQNTNQNEG